LNGLSVWRVTAFQPMPTVYTASLTALVGVLAFRFIFLKCIYRCHAQLRVAVSRYTCIYSLGERVFQLVSRLTLINNSLWSSMWKEDHAHIVPLQAKRKKWSSLPLSFFHWRSVEWIMKVDLHQFRLLSFKCYHVCCDMNTLAGLMNHGWSCF
jgi:hypothetical protein